MVRHLRDTSTVQYRDGLHLARQDWSPYCRGGAIALPLHVGQIAPPVRAVSAPLEVSPPSATTALSNTLLWHSSCCSRYCLALYVLQLVLCATFRAAVDTVRHSSCCSRLCGLASLLACAPLVQVLRFRFDSSDVFDVMTVSSTSHDAAATAAGTVDGVLMWWDLTLAPGVTYSTSPDDPAWAGDQWQDHWCPIVFPLPQVVPVAAAGDRVRLMVAHSATSVWFKAAAGDRYGRGGGG